MVWGRGELASMMVEDPVDGDGLGRSDPPPLEPVGSDLKGELELSSPCCIRAEGGRPGAPRSGELPPPAVESGLDFCLVAFL